MKVTFLLGWTSGEVNKRDFKSSDAFGLFSDYVARIASFTECRAAGFPKTFSKSASIRVWLCDPSPKTKALSSREISKEIDKLQLIGIKELMIIIGGSDGLNTAQKELLLPDLLWHFGPMTLPHELAAVVASEQVYRAFTILKGLPYHCGH